MPLTLTWRRFSKWLAISALVLGVLALTAYALRAPILTWVGGQLIDVDADAPADAIVVLAGGTPERELAAVDLFHRQMAPVIVITQPAERPQWDLARARGVAIERDQERRLRLIRELHVPDDRVVVLPPVVVSTIGEAAATAAWVRERHVRSLTIVTSAFHTGRAKLIFRRALAGLDVAIRMHAAEAGTFRADNWWRTRADLTDGIIEWQKHVLYQLRFYRSR